MKLSSVKLGGRDIFVWGDFARSHDQSDKWFYGWELLKVCHHATKSGYHKHCGSEDIIVLVCHITNWSYDL